MLTRPLPVTVCLPVKNEARNLPRCLDCLGDSFASVVVIDSSSTDDTASVAREFGAELLQFSWDGKFPKKRNWVLRNHAFQTPWVLFLDADEFITSEFIAELGEVLPGTAHVGFWIPFENWFMGQRLRYGDSFCKLALFRVDSGEYERFPEDGWSCLDMEVHEHPVLNGSVGRLRSRVRHQDYRGLHHYFAKHNEYSSWEARRFRWLRSGGDGEWGRLTNRQRFKYRFLNRFWLAWLYWFVAYVLKFGFLDGRAGWVFNGLKRRYFSDIRLKVREGE